MQLIVRVVNNPSRIARAIVKAHSRCAKKVQFAHAGLILNVRHRKAQNENRLFIWVVVLVNNVEKQSMMQVRAKHNDVCYF